MITKEQENSFILNYPNNGKLWCIKNLNFTDAQVRYYADKFNLVSNFKHNKESDYNRGSAFRGKKRPEHSKHMKKIGFVPANYFTNESLKKMSLKSVLQMKNQNTYSNAKRGYYNINGKNIYFRSKWEANYALYLDFLIKIDNIKSWEFEPDTFWFNKIKRGVRSYTPDFKVYDFDGSIEYHEVKGYMDAKSKTKLKRMRIYYPDIKMVVIDKSIYKDILKSMPIKFFD